MQAGLWGGLPISGFATFRLLFKEDIEITVVIIEVHTLQPYRTSSKKHKIYTKLLVRPQYGNALCECT